MKPLAAAALVLAAAACAPPPASPGQPPPGAQARRECFDAASVDGFHGRDETTVDLRAAAGQVFRLELLGACDAEWASGLTVQPWGASSRLCPGDNLDVFARAPGTGVRKCSARVVRRLTPAELRSPS